MHFAAARGDIAMIQVNMSTVVARDC
jgi:hypothetical protein